MAIAGAASMLAASIPAQAQTRAGDGNAIDFVVGNIEYLLVHELAHLLIGEKSVPIVGPVENAADYIATLALIREAPLDPAEQDRALKFLLAAASAFEASWRRGDAFGAAVPYWDSHALSIQRYYQIACLLYGSDPDAFADIPRATGLPEARAAGCADEYLRASRAADWLLESYGRQSGDTNAHETEIVYEGPPTMVSMRVVERLQSLELLERIIDRFHQRFSLEEPFTVAMRTCNRSEAAWVPERRELLICYELVDTLYLLGLAARPLE